MSEPATPHVLVVGGGPAGMSAARTARRHGARVTLLEAGDDLGGQYWRHLPEERSGEREHLLHHGWATFRTLRADLLADPGCDVVLGAHVWSVERRTATAPKVNAVIGDADGTRRTPRSFEADAVVFATGAQERTLPFPGWDLPGVFTGGAAQALAKGERVAVGGRVLVTGAGPFLLPVASSLVRTGATVVGVVEAAGWRQVLTGWTPKPWQLFAARAKAAELGGYLADLARYRIPYRAGAAVVAAHGDDRLEAVTVAALNPDWSPVPGTQRRVAVDAVCVSHGFVPRTELATAAGCALEARGAVAVDPHQRTSATAVFSAGELTGIGGVDLALAEGEVAGAAAAGGVPAAAALRRRDAGRSFADRLETAHGIRPGWQRWLDDATTVCRCEDVTVGELREVAELTCARGLRSLKLTTRAGLGPCQGRTCGRSVEDILAAATGSGLLETGRTAHRPIAVPVRLGELAAITTEPRSRREDPL